MKKLKQFLKELPLKTLNLIWRIIKVTITTLFKVTLAYPFSLFNKLMKNLDYHYRKDTIYTLIILILCMSFNLFFMLGCDVKEKAEIIKPAQASTKQEAISKLPKVYNYNDQIPKELVILEIITQAKAFGLNADVMLQLADDESDFNNLAKNPNSTALGVYQYLIGTWEETESFIRHKTSRTDYKANIREAMIDVSNGETFRWEMYGK